MKSVLAIDVGSSSLKIGLFSLDGLPLAHAFRPTVTSEPRPGFKEQDPESWWQATCETLREIVQTNRPNEIAAIGASGHISSLTFVTSAGMVLRPAIGFQDLRALDELDELYRRFPRPVLAERMGIDLPPAATWPLPKFLWLKKHEPQTLDSAHRVLQAKDYVNFRLTGEFASDASSFRGLVDFSRGGVASDVLSDLGLRKDLIPSLFAPHQVIGTVTPAAAQETGLPEGLPVVAGWNDLNACVLGSGAVNPGEAFNVTGTSEHLGVVTAQMFTAPELICAPYLPGKQLFYGVTSSGAGSLAWLEKILGTTAEGLLEQSEMADPGANALLFLPYLEGERSPIWDPKAAGAFVGLHTAHRAAHMARAVLEGVAFSLRQISELVARHAANISGPVVVSGGAARAQLWNQIKADILGRAVATTANPQAGILGAAILAAVGAGAYRDCEEAAGTMVQRGDVFHPHTEHAALYDALFGAYRRLYPALKDSFAALHSIRRG